MEGGPFFSAWGMPVSQEWRDYDIVKKSLSKTAGFLSACLLVGLVGALLRAGQGEVPIAEPSGVLVSPGSAILSDTTRYLPVEFGSAQPVNFNSREALTQAIGATIELIRGDMEAPSGFALSLARDGSVEVMVRAWSHLKLPEDGPYVSMRPKSSPTEFLLQIPRTKPFLVDFETLLQGHIGVESWAGESNATISPQMSPVRVSTRTGVPIKGALLEVTAPTGPEGVCKSLEYPCDTMGMSTPVLLGNESLRGMFGTLSGPAIFFGGDLPQRFIDYRADFTAIVNVNSNLDEPGKVQLGLTRLDLPASNTENLECQLGEWSKCNVSPGSYRITCNSSPLTLLDPTGRIVDSIDIDLGVDVDSVRVNLTVSARNGGALEIVDAETGTLLEDAWIEGELYMPTPGPNPTGGGSWVRGLPRRELERKNASFLVPAIEGYLPDDLSLFRLVIGSNGYDSTRLEDCSGLHTGSFPRVTLRRIEMIPLTVESSSGRLFGGIGMIQEVSSGIGGAWNWPSKGLMVPRGVVGKDVRFYLVGKGGGRQPMGVFPVSESEGKALIVLPTSTIRIVGLPEGTTLSASPGVGVSYEVEARRGTVLFDGLVPGLWVIGSPAAVQDQVFRRLKDSQAVVPGLVTMELAGAQERLIDSAELGTFGILNGTCEVLGDVEGDVKIAPYYARDFTGHHGGTVPGWLALERNGTYVGEHPSVLPSWVMALAPVGVGQFPGDTIAIGVGRPLQGFNARSGSLEIQPNSGTRGNLFVQVTPELGGQVAGAPIVLSIPEGTSGLLPVLPEGPQTLTLSGEGTQKSSVDVTIVAGEKTRLSL